MLNIHWRPVRLGAKVAIMPVIADYCEVLACVLAGQPSLHGAN